MEKKEAFLLVELVIYLSLVSILSLTLFSFFSSVEQYSNFVCYFSDKLIRQELLFDLVSRDMLSASNKIYDWDKKNLIFKQYIINQNGDTKSLCVGFDFKNNKINRVEGIYDFQKRLWQNKKTSLAWVGTIDMQWKLEKDQFNFENVIGVWVFCTMKNAKIKNEIKRFFRLRNRVI